ncbi:hypothetical protein PTKIN_Ptkin06aG0138500 [Pterospermum kingtungense]
MADNSVPPPLCARGCGFYGSRETKNLCSKCYKDFHKEIMVSDTSTPPDPCVSTLINRCQSCNKKVGLLGFSCRCGNVFCGAHRYPKHACNFDFKTADRLNLAKQNPLLKGDKLQYRI